jgi:hypothetical protein
MSKENKEKGRRNKERKEGKLNELNWVVQNFVEREVGLIYRGNKLWLIFTIVKLI